MRLFLSIFSILLVYAVTIAQDSIKITYYNLLDFPAAQQDRIDTLKKVLDYVKPDIFVVNELTSFNGAALIKNNALNTSGVNRFSSAVFYDGPDTDNMLFYEDLSCLSKKLEFLDKVLKFLLNLYHIYFLEELNQCLYHIYYLYRHPYLYLFLK